MDILYILLGDIQFESEKSAAPAVSVNLSTDAIRNGISWPPESSKVKRPIDYLVESAKSRFWIDQANRVLERYPEDKSYDWTKLIESGPGVLVGIGLTKDVSKMKGSKSSLILRELVSEAKKNQAYKAIFIFPSKWSETTESIADQLLKEMVSEIWDVLSELPVEKELPWAFLTWAYEPSQPNPLQEFIRLFHSEMLTRKNTVNVMSCINKSGTILLSGPTGSGKSYAAKLIADNEKYKGQIVEVNLAAISNDHLESRMRGYLPGSFTGADKKGRAGFFEEANGGVLFLDEFQAVPVDLQVQLLDLLSAVSDEIKVARMGAEHERQIFTVKVILAINEDVNVLIGECRLREDIYYRIRHIENFQSLKERLDVDDYRYLRALLASYRWKSLASLKQLETIKHVTLETLQTFFPKFELEAFDHLKTHTWPGNFRELERVAFDLYYELDTKHNEIIDRRLVQYVMNSWQLKDVQKSSLDEMSGADSDKLNKIQQALRDSRFVIANALKKQAYCQSRPTLKKYLSEKIDYLDQDILTDSRIRSFLKLTES